MVVRRNCLTSFAPWRGPLPDDLILELILAENLIEHDFDVVAGVPVTVVIEASHFLEHAV